MGDTATNEIHDLGRNVFRWRDVEDGLAHRRVRENRVAAVTDWFSVATQKDGISHVEELASRGFEIRDGGIENSEIKIWRNKLQYAVGFKDHVLRRGDFASK